MSIIKPFRHLLILFLTIVAMIGVLGVIASFLPRLAIWVWMLIALPLFVVINILVGIPVDALDFWIRRRTHDPAWLETSEGEMWLQTAEGRAWLATIQGEKWSKTGSRR